MSDFVHNHLPCGMEYGVVPLPDRRVVTFQIKMLAGYCTEPSDKLGLAQITEDTLDKGTTKRTGRELSDAFDAIGAATGSSAGKETTTFTCTVLPEHFERAVELHAEMLREPTFPEDAVSVALDLTHQELLQLEDDAQSLSDKLIGRNAYGPVLGRHVLGEPETLAQIKRSDVENFWRSHFHAGRMLVAVAGAITPDDAARVFEHHFSGFGKSEQAGREPFPVEFKAGTEHFDKELEQEHIGICFPGVAPEHDDFPVQQVIMGVLSGGMSGRLFTEVREKQGLVYWVGAWHETPRKAGMIFLGASTMPDRCDQTYETLLREVDRLSEDLEQEELDRAVTGIVSSRETRGDTTRSRCAELVGDLFHFGRPVPPEEKSAKIKAVTIKDVHRYLAAHPRDALCVVTLGPRALCNGSVKQNQ